MPKTKFQEFIYGVLMTFFMVLAMELYNTGMRMGGLTNDALPLALHEMTFMFPICFVMGFCFIDRLTPKIAFRMATPRCGQSAVCYPGTCVRHCGVHVPDHELLGDADLQAAGHRVYPRMAADRGM